MKANKRKYTLTSQKRRLMNPVLSL